MRCYIINTRKLNKEKRLNAKKLKRNRYLLLLSVFVCFVLALPREDLVLKNLGFKDKTLSIRRGLDLQGGAYLTYEADLAGIKNEDKNNAVNSVIKVINQRINPTGTSEVSVQSSSGNRIIVQIPGSDQVESSLNLIGKTAELYFCEVENAATQTSAEDFDFTAKGCAFYKYTDAGLTGKDLANAKPDINPQTGQPVVSFTMKNDAILKFGQLTTQINQRGTRLAIILDNQILFNGTVRSPILNGQGELTGLDNIDSAKTTATLLNAGALPVPIKLVEQRTIGASLGNESVAKSLIAGLIGLLAIAIFMIIHYRKAGIVASLALFIYTILNIAIFKLSVLTPFTIVLTLAGIAGFILSIGMAVDANILIFERTKEELRRGKNLQDALNSGFNRAWSSIKDSNISTLITCAILYTFGVTAIKGFAVTLAIGVVISMFTAITISRQLLTMFLGNKKIDRTMFGEDMVERGVK